MAAPAATTAAPRAFSDIQKTGDYADFIKLYYYTFDKKGNPAYRIPLVVGKGSISTLQPHIGDDGEWSGWFVMVTTHGVEYALDENDGGKLGRWLCK